MSPDFFTLLEHQLTEAAERDVAPARGWRHTPSGGPRGLWQQRPRTASALPVAAALACAALIAGLALSVTGEELRPGRDAAAGGAPPAGIAPPAAPGGASEQAAANDTSVFVMNATSVNGVAARAARELELAGFQIAGTGNDASHAVQVSRVAARDAAAGALVARTLGISGPVQPLARALRAQAPGAEVVVVLGADFTRLRGTRRSALNGADGARGTVTIADTTRGQQLELEATRVARGKPYLVWLESRAGRTRRLGFAQFVGPVGVRGGRLTGSAELSGAQLSPRRIFVTRQAAADAHGPVVLDTGRLPPG